MDIFEIIDEVVMEDANQIQHINTNKNITIIYSANDKLKDPSVFNEVELAYNVKLPLDLKNFIEKYNGCNIKVKFESEKSELNECTYEMKSFNKDESFNVLDKFDIKYYNDKSIKFIPLIHDGMGNYFGITDNGISYHDHETDKITKIVKSWTKFISDVKYWEDAYNGYM